MVRVVLLLPWVVLGAIFLAVLAVLYWDDQRYIKEEPVVEVEEEKGGVPLPIDIGMEVGLWILSM